MDFVVAFVAYGMWIILGKKLSSGPAAGGGAGGKGGGGKGLAAKIWFVRPAMLLICSASLANTFLGIWSAKAVRVALGWLGGLVHTPGALIAGGIGLLLLLGTILDLKDKKPDGIAKTGLVMLPILALVATGPLAHSGSGLFDSISQASMHGLSSMIGG